MGSEQFERGVGNEFLSENVKVDIIQDESNQYDDDIKNRDVATNPVNTGEQNISGADEIAGDIEVKDGGSVDLELEWMDGSGNVTTTQTPSELQGVTGTEGNDFLFTTKSTHFRIKMTGTSNQVSATLNAH